MIEIIVGVLVASFLGGGATATAHWWINRHYVPERVAIEAPRVVITKEMQDELDRTPAWWDRQYHRGLAEAGAAVVARIDGESFDEYSYGGAQVTTHRTADRVALDGCTCAECTHVLANGYTVRPFAVRSKQIKRIYENVTGNENFKRIYG